MTFLTKPGILVLRNQSRLDDATLSMSSILVVFRGLVGMTSIFVTVRLTELCSKTGYRTLTSLKM